MAFRRRGSVGSPTTVFARRWHGGPTRLLILAPRPFFRSHKHYSFGEDGLRNSIGFSLELKNTDDQKQ